MGFHQSSWFDQPKCSSREKPVQYQDSYLHWGIWAQLYTWLETLMLDVGQYCLSRPCPFKFLKAIFHKFYLVHSWILCAIWEFSEGSHWSDYPSVITEPEAKEEFLKRGKKVFFSVRMLIMLVVIVLNWNQVFIVKAHLVWHFAAKKGWERQICD